MSAQERSLSLASRWLDALLLALVKLGTSALVLASGFRALSDDDYSRIVIAQRFAEAPTLDPSGTSWLPVPFWVYGATFALFGSDLAVARAVALALGVVSVLLVWAAAQLFGAARLGALIGALLAAAFPYSAWLGAATVPEAPTAGLIVFATATLSRAEPKVRLAGALALATACFSRYEAWPVALVFALLNTLDAWKGRERTLFVASLLALGSIGLWVLHGVFVHDDAFFFVTRVTAYRAALGGEPLPWLERALSYPLALVRFEPELVVLAALALIFAKPAERARYRRAWLLFGSLLAFTVVGELRGGTPTHHEERVLLSLWFGLAVIAGDLGSLALAQFSRACRAFALAGVSLLAVGALAARSRLADVGHFAERSQEVAIGEAARRVAGAPEARLAIACDDYGYFAVMAGFGSPKRAVPLEHHDPRTKNRPDLLSDRGSLERALSAAGAHLLVFPTRREDTLSGFGRVIARNPGFVLIDTSAQRAP